METLLKKKSIVYFFLASIVLLQFVITGTNPLELHANWSSHELLVDYSYGFIRRGLMGSLVTLLSRIFQADIYTVIIFTKLAGTIVFVALLFFYIYYFIKHTNARYAVVMVTLFVAMGGFSFYFLAWGEMDIYLLALTITACFLIIKDRFLWLVPFLVAACVMIHEGYVLMYFGIIIAILFYRATVDEDPKKRKKYWIILLSTGLVASILFIYFYFFSTQVSSIHIDEVIRKTKQVLNEDFHIPDLKYIYVGNSEPNFAMWVDGKPTGHFLVRVLAVAMNTIVCLPIIIILFNFWKTVISKNAERNKRLIIVLCVASQLLTVPLVISHLDQARWFYDVVFFNFLFITAVICIGDKSILFAAEKYFKPTVITVAVIIFYFIICSFMDMQKINELYFQPISFFLKPFVQLIGRENLHL